MYRVKSERQALEGVARTLRVLAILILLALVDGCHDEIANPQDQCRCDVRDFSGLTPVEPLWSATRPSLSVNQRHLAFHVLGSYDLFVFDLETRQSQNIPRSAFLHNDIEATTCLAVTWSTTSPTTMLVLGQFQSVMSRHIYRRLFLFDLVSQVAEDITPNSFGDSTLFPTTIQWSPRSTPSDNRLIFNGYEKQSLDTSYQAPSVYHIERRELELRTAGIDIWETPSGILKQDKRTYPPVITLNEVVLPDLSSTLVAVNVANKSDCFVAIPLGPIGSNSCRYESSAWFVEQHSDKNHVLKPFNFYGQYCIVTTGSGYAIMASDTTMYVIGRRPNASEPSAFLVKSSGEIVSEYRLTLR